MRTVLVVALFAFVVMFCAYLILELVPSEAFGGDDRVRLVSQTVSKVGQEAWAFARPLLQLVIIFLILEWLLRKTKDEEIKLQSLLDKWDIRAVLALLVVAAFSLAALSGGPGIGALQDVALVVLGFYFGGLRGWEAKGADTD